MLLGARQFFERRGAPTWTNPYVTDGLVAMWDGEWNAGGGVHDASTNVWKDLVGNCDWTLVNPSWSGSALLLGTQRYGYMDSTATAATFSQIATGGTMEIVLTPNEILWYSTLIKSAADVGFNFNTYNSIGFRSSRSPSTGYDELMQNSTWNVSVIYGNTVESVEFYRNAESRSLPYMNSIGGYAVNGGTIIGARSTSNTSYSLERFCDLNIHTLRLYSRALTAAEIADNYAIDKARFNQP